MNSDNNSIFGFMLNNFYDFLVSILEPINVSTPLLPLKYDRAIIHIKYFNLIKQDLINFYTYLCILKTKLNKNLFYKIYIPDVMYDIDEMTHWMKQYDDINLSYDNVYSDTEEFKNLDNQRKNKLGVLEHKNEEPKNKKSKNKKSKNKKSKNKNKSSKKR